MRSREEALAEGVRFLLERQDADGLWRDYRLEPGASEAWTTSCVGLAVDRAAPDAASRAVANARAAVAQLGGEMGWGYNSNTACDADTTAWTLRFLGGRGDTQTLGWYVDPAGHAHTFADPAMFGTWSGEHADVTPAVGLALVEGGVAADTVRIVRDACLSNRRADGSWRSFWWATDAYATSLNLEFLAASGGAPPAVTAGAAGWLGRRGSGHTALEASRLLDVARLSGAVMDDRLTDILSRQDEDGGWPASAVLLVPDQVTGQPGPCKGDPRRLFTTATAVLSIAAIE